MNSPPPIPGATARLRNITTKTSLLLALLFGLTSQSLQAGSATWNLNPTSGDWNTAVNWTPNTVPNGPDDTATFDISNQTALSFSADTEVNEIVFNLGAEAYTITVPGKHLTTISGAGIVNNSGVRQLF